MEKINNKKHIKKCAGVPSGNIGSGGIQCLSGLGRLV